MEANYLKIIFLDIDGVLNSHSTTDFCGPYRGIDDNKISLLKSIVDATNSKIVLISSWKEHWFKDKKLKHKQDDLANYLDSKLKNQGLSILDKTSVYILNRGEGIIYYLNKLHLKGVEVEKYIIIDDEMFDYKKTGLSKYLIKTSYYKNGLEEKHVRKVVKKLC